VPALRQPGTRRRPNAKDLGISSYYTVPSCSGQMMWHFNDKFCKLSAITNKIKLATE